MLGAGTVLVPAERAGGKTIGLAFDGLAEDRLLVLLAAAYGQPVPRRVLGNIRRASRYFRDGQRHLAAIELALTGLPPLPDDELASHRLDLADRVIAQGVAPRELLKALGADPLSSKAGFNPNQPRVPAGNPEGGRWGDGDGDGTAIILAEARRPAEPAQRTDSRDKFTKFFDTLYRPIHALAQRLGIDETWLFGLAAYESEWLSPHNRTLNNPFGVTHGGGPDVGYASIDDAVAYWEKKFGPVARGATGPADFAQRLWDARYNRANPAWRSGLTATILSNPKHLDSWKSRRGIP